MEKQKKHAGLCFAALLYILFGILFAWILNTAFKQFMRAEGTFGEILLLAAILFLFFLGAVVIQTILHEAGHLVFGLLSGYTFCSFRIFSLTWIKENGRIRLRRLSVAGTGGQCLMAPPEPIDGKFPVILYNLGGAMMNLLTSVVFLLLYLLLRRVSFLSLFFLMLSATGFLFAALNGVPLRLGAVDNDGYNAFSLGRSPAAMRSLWVQMKVNERLAQGVRLKDMPDEWFDLPVKQATGNSLIAAHDVLVCNRLMDAKRFDEADARMEQLLGTDSGMIGLHRGLLICDRMYIALLDPNRYSTLNSLLTKAQRKFMKSMKDYPSVLRTNFAYALCYEKDIKKAAALLKHFEKRTKSYPYPSEIQGERELIELAAQNAKQRK